MGTRRQAREMAMQALFSMDMNGVFDQQKLNDYCGCFPPGKRLQEFFERLALGVLENRAAIDNVIERYSSNWKIRRMACVDRNVLRLSVFELMYCGDIPFKVTINEGVDIAKKFGSAESGAFINGILDSIRSAIENKELRPVVPKGPAGSQDEEAET